MTIQEILRHSHLRLFHHIAIERNSVVGLRKALVHVVQQVDAGGAGRGAIVVAAGIVAGCRRVQAAAGGNTLCSLGRGGGELAVAGRVAGVARLEWLLLRLFAGNRHGEGGG